MTIFAKYLWFFFFFFFFCEPKYDPKPKNFFYNNIYIYIIFQYKSEYI